MSPTRLIDCGYHPIVAAKKGSRRIAVGVQILSGLVSFAALAGLTVMLVKEWRAGTAFHRYRDWEGHLTSHADLLILLVASTAALIGGLIWRWWDQRRDERLIAEIRARREKRTSER
jgi:hypothetical protein